MANITLSKLMKNIADAIRYKTGETALIAAMDFPDKIKSIAGGGGDPDRLLYKEILPMMSPNVFSINQTITIEKDGKIDIYVKIWGEKLIVKINNIEQTVENRSYLYTCDVEGYEAKKGDVITIISSNNGGGVGYYFGLILDESDPTPVITGEGITIVDGVNEVIEDIAISALPDIIGTYRYFKFEIGTTRSTATSKKPIQFNRIFLMKKGEEYIQETSWTIFKGITVNTENLNVNGSHPANNILQCDNKKVYAEYTDSSLPCSFIIDLGEENGINIDEYDGWCWVNADDAARYTDRQPKDFSFKCSIDGVTWKTLDTVTNYLPETIINNDIGYSKTFN